MSDKIEVNQSGGIGIAGALTIIFVLAKLFNLVSWSWWVVFAPLIVSFSILLVILAFVAVVAGMALYFGTK